MKLLGKIAQSGGSRGLPNASYIHSFILQIFIKYLRRVIYILELGSGVLEQTDTTDSNPCLYGLTFEVTFEDKRK